MPRNKKPLLRLIAPLLGAALVLTGCSGGSGGTDNTGPEAEAATLRVNFSGFPENWTPGQEMEGGLLRVPYETLLAPGENGHAEPFLASDYELEPESLTLTLQEGVTFHDGEPFNAEAVKVNVETVQAGATVWSGSFATIESIDVVDDYTVKFNLSEPSPSLPTVLTTRALPIASPKAIADGTIAQTPVGTSPWAYDDSLSIVGTKLYFGAFAEYWGEKPGFANVEIFGINESEAAAAALTNGEIDLSDVEDSVLPNFEGTDIQTFDYPAIRNNLIFFDRGEGGLFESQELRQAICTAINVDEAANVIGKITPVSQHFAEGELGHNPDIAGYPFDLDNAQALYAEAGSPSVSFEIAAAPYNEQQISIYMDQASQIGDFSATVSSMPPPQFASVWASGQYPAGLAANDEMTPYDWYQSWFAADAAGNPSGTESEALKTAADEAIAAGDSEEATELWGTVTQIISDEALTCAHAQSAETIAYNSTTVSGIDAPAEPWEAQSVNYRDLVPAS
ncbi:MAG: ABC transporter substrate-binding protein [Gulosibacter sp.]|uniref:ABC transporter substrate-binding protein n=1 Tax=Gulosibacter sp. TaxID=2817531 RepID=UPI003F8F980F